MTKRTQGFSMATVLLGGAMAVKAAAFFVATLALTGSAFRAGVVALAYAVFATYRLGK